jgi:O-antigen/teichoic acid export membrane protein
MTDQAPRTGLGSTAARNSFATVAVRLSNLLVGMILTPFLLHGIGPELYGVLVVTTSTYDYLSLLRGGLGGALRRFVTLYHHAGDHEKAHQYYAAGFWWAALLRGGIFLIGLVLAAPLTGFLRVSASARADCALGIALLITGTVVLDTSTMLEIPSYATAKTAGLSVAKGAVSWLRVGLTVLAFRLMGASLSVAGIAGIGTAVVSTILIGILAQRTGVVGAAFPKPQFGAPDVRRELFRYGGLSLLNQAAELLYLTTDHLLIGRFFGAGAVTHYSMGARWYPLIYSFIVVPITAMTPLFTSLEARGERERSKGALRRIVGVAAVMGITVCLVPCIIGDLFLNAWVGPQYRDSVNYLIVMLAPLTIDVAAAPVWMILYARGRIGAIVTLIVPIALGNVALSIILGLGFHMGPLGFAIGNGAAMIARNVALFILLKRRPDPHIPPMRVAMQPLVPALLGGLPGLVLLYFGRGLLAGGLPRVIAGGTLGGIVCLTGSLLATFGPRGIRELFRTAMSAFSRSRRSSGTGGEGTPPAAPAAE